MPLGVLEMAVLSWLEDQEPEDLRRLAERDGDATADLLAEYRDMLGYARRIVGRSALERMRNMGDKDFDRLLDLALQRCPAQGRVCWEHKAWFIRQARLARDRFLGVAV
jgi:hypothetical protein